MVLKIHGVVRLGGDPETKDVGETTVTNFSAAHTHRYKKDGEWEETPVWLRCAMWGNRGQVIQDYVAKGRQIEIVGELVPDPDTGGPRIWFGNDGEPRASFEVRLSDFGFVGSKSDNGGGGSDSKSIADGVPWD